MSIFDPDYDGTDDRNKPLFAPGIYYRLGAQDAKVLVLPKRIDIPAPYQDNYDQGYDEYKKMQPYLIATSM